MNLVKLVGLAALGLATLTACGGGTDISGTYTGTLTCFEIDIDASMTLTADEDDDTKFNGEFSMNLPVQLENPQDPTTPIIVFGDFIATVEATIDPKEDAQEIDIDASLDRVENCERNGEALDDCTGLGTITTNTGLQDQVEFDEADFDGENTLSFDANDCEGDLTRPAP